MLRHAQKGNAFYAAPEDHLCGAALHALGKDLPLVLTYFHKGLEVFDSPRAASRLYDHIPRLQERRGIEYVTLAPLDKLTYEPDLLYPGHPWRDNWEAAAQGGRASPAGKSVDQLNTA